MRADGGAALSLGAEVHDLCDLAALEARRLIGAGRRVQDAWRRSPAVRALALHPKIHAALAAAYGRKPFAFQTLNFETGSEQPAHSDVMHFSSLPHGFMCGVWIALEDVGDDAGPLLYYPGSHRLPRLTMEDVGSTSLRRRAADYERLYVPHLAKLIAESDLPARRLLIRKGEAFVWAADLAHGGAPIETKGTTRRSLVVHFYFEDCFYYTPMTSDLKRGRLDVRLPPDVGGGRMVWPMRNGRRARVPLRKIASAVRRDLMARPFVS
jgi:ectoine hydroxylase-related dioxygenase (phytanoyl-CoA dioxygenase family)